MCECEDDKKKRGRGHGLRPGRQKPAASYEEIRAFLENHLDETGELPSLNAVHEELGGSFTRLTRIREAFALERGIKLKDARRAKASDAPLLGGGLDAKALEPLLKKALKGLLNDVTLQTTLALNDQKREFARQMEQLNKKLDETARPNRNWRQEMQSLLIDTLTRVGLADLTSPALEQLRARRRKGGKAAGPTAADMRKMRPPKPARAPGPRAHPAEKLAFERFTKSEAQRARLLQEAAKAIMASDDMDTGLALIRGCLRAAGGFGYAAMATGQRSRRLQQAFGTRGEPTVPELMATLGFLARAPSASSPAELAKRPPRGRARSNYFEKLFNARVAPRKRRRRR